MNKFEYFLEYTLIGNIISVFITIVGVILAACLVIAVCVGIVALVSWIAHTTHFVIGIIFFFLIMSMFAGIMEYFNI